MVAKSAAAAAAAADIARVDSESDSDGLRGARAAPRLQRLQRLQRRLLRLLRRLRRRLRWYDYRDSDCHSRAAVCLPPQSTSMAHWRKCRRSSPLPHLPGPASEPSAAPVFRIMIPVLWTQKICD